MSSAALAVTGLSPARQEMLFRQLRRPAAPAAAREFLQSVRVGDGHNFKFMPSGPGVIDSFKAIAMPRRRPGPGEVEVEVHAASLNFRDLMIVLGLYPQMHNQRSVMGTDWSGRIVAIGEGVHRLRLGDEVIGLVAAGFSPYVTFSERRVVCKPRCLSFQAASTIPTVYLTAWYALKHLGRLHEGERVLIHSATGGVGLAAIQIARSRNARIFATAGSEGKRATLRAMGIAHVFDSRSLDWVAGIDEATGGEGVDVILNSIPGEAIQRGMECLRPGGRFLEIGVRDFMGEATLPLRLFRHAASFIGTGVVHFPIEQESFIVREMLDEIVQLFDDGVFAQPLNQVFALPDIAEAFAYIAEGVHVGKVTLEMAGQRVMVASRGAPLANLN